MKGVEWKATCGHLFGQVILRSVTHLSGRYALGGGRFGRIQDTVVGKSLRHKVEERTVESHCFPVKYQPAGSKKAKGKGDEPVIYTLMELLKDPTIVARF
ncbi:hypothetical protein GOBAR_DD28545 [Gossypium barbadense]|nr:hypothetical protein GOBAR_DD28545 [Gossypium barbadense]